MSRHAPFNPAPPANAGDAYAYKVRARDMHDAARVLNAAAPTVGELYAALRQIVGMADVLERNAS